MYSKPNLHMCVVCSSTGFFWCFLPTHPRQKQLNCKMCSEQVRRSTEIHVGHLHTIQNRTGNKGAYQRRSRALEQANLTKFSGHQKFFLLFPPSLLGKFALNSTKDKKPTGKPCSIQAIHPNIPIRYQQSWSRCQVFPPTIESEIVNLSERTCLNEVNP